MKKGFTLIELLAVIAILAGILIISVPKILDVVDDTKVKIYQDNEKMVLTAVDKYLAENQQSVPFNLGETKEVSLNSLKSGGYLKDIIVDGSFCSGYVLITRKTKKELSYNPQIKCGVASNIFDSSSDNLVAYYSFDNFAESVTNLAPLVPASTGWDNYNFAATQNQYVDFNGLYEATKMTCDDSFQARTEFNLAAPTVDTYYTFSVYTKKGDNSPYASLHTRFDPYDSPYLIVNLDTGEMNVSTTGVYDYGALYISDGWWRIYMTVLVKPDQTYQIFKLIQTSSATDPTASSIGDSVYYWHPQVEASKYVTPYTDSTRTDSVLDYSVNSNTGSLTVSNSPTYIEESKNGYYEFDGIDDYITLNQTITDEIMSSNFTLSSWVKSNGFESGMIEGCFFSIGYSLNMWIDTSGHLIIRVDNGTSFDTYTYSGLNLLDNEFHYINATYDGSNIKLYSDGEELLNQPATFVNRYTNVGKIGYDNNNGSTTRFKGYLDDMKIYNRALSDEEIKYQYDVSKYKYE